MVASYYTSSFNIWRADSFNSRLGCCAIYLHNILVTKILGISAFYHDSAATIIQDGKIIAAAQEERFTRKSTTTPAILLMLLNLS